MVTDHRSLVYLTSQDNLLPRQVRWWEFLSRFNFRITYVKGSLNIVADALSRKFEGLLAAQTRKYPFRRFATTRSAIHPPPKVPAAPAT